MRWSMAPPISTFDASAQALTASHVIIAYGGASTDLTSFSP